MELIKDFNIVFTLKNGAETVAENWIRYEQNCYSYFNTKFDNLNVSVLINKNDEILYPVLSAYVFLGMTR